MKLSFNMYGGQTIIKQIPIYGNGTSLVEGAVVIKGATSGTNQGFGIVGASALAGVLGVITTAHTNTSAGTDSKADGTAYSTKGIIINPDAVYEASHVGTIAVASTSTTTVTITSLENGIAGGWLFGSDYQLQYIVTSSSGSCTTKTATSWTSATTVAKVHPVFFKLLALSTDASKITNAAAAATGKAAYIENYIRSNSIPRQRLNPTIHSGLTLDSSAVISSEIIFTDHAFGPTSA